MATDACWSTPNSHLITSLEDAEQAPAASSARSPVSSSKHLRPLVVPPGPRSILDRILLRRRLNPRANEPGASTRAGQPVWAGRLAGQVGADRSGGGGERSDAGEGAVAFAMTAFDQQDCPHENPPPSRCSRSAIRLRGLPLPTRRHRAGGALVSADGDGVGPDEARPGQEPVPGPGGLMFLIRVAPHRLIRGRATTPYKYPGGREQQLVVRLARENPRWATSASRANCFGLACASRRPRSG